MGNPKTKYGLDSPDQPQIDTGVLLTQVFVGRQLELSRLRQSLEDAHDGQGGIAVLVGEPGIGKTRTAHEFAAYAARRGVTVLWGICYEGEAAPPYGPWTAALRSHIESSTADELTHQLPQGAREIAEIIPELGEKLPDLTAPVVLPSAEARVRLFDCLIRFVRNIARENTLLVVLDNLQWADPDSLQFLERLVNETQESRLLVLGTYREEDLGRAHPLVRLLGELVKHRAFRRVHLGGLSENDIETYLSRVAGSAPESGLVAEIHQRTAGNPLFLVETVRQMRDGLEAVRAAGSVPEGVRDAIRRRLAVLAEECVDILALASVIGRSFELDLLTRLADGPSQDQVLGHLEHAGAAGFIEELVGSRTGYRFTHVLIQETLAEELSAARRAKQHVRVVEAMEDLYGPDPGPRSGELFRHVTQAAGVMDSDKLVRYALVAADYALGRYAPDEALSILDRALATIKRRGGDAKADMAALLHARGRAQVDMGHSGANNTLIHAFDLYEECGDTPRAVEVALTNAYGVLRIGRFECWSGVTTGIPRLRRRALRMVDDGSVDQGRLLSHGDCADLEKALVIAREHDDPSLELRSLAHLARQHSCAGDFEASVREETRAMEMADRLHDLDALHLCHYWRGFRGMIRGDCQSTRRAAATLLDLAQRTRSRRHLCFAHHMSAQLACAMGDWDDCRSHGARNLALQLTHAGMYSHETALIALAVTEFETGHFETAQGYLRRLGEVSGCPEAPAPFAAAKIARITGDTGSLGEAETIVNSIPRTEGGPFRWWPMSRDVALALSAVVRRDTVAATDLLGRFESLKGRYMPSGAAGKSSDALLGLLCLTVGRLDEAASHLEDAVAFCRCGYRPELAWAHYDYARVLLRRDKSGDAAKARALLGEGSRISSDLDMRPLFEKIKNVLKQVDKTALSPLQRTGLSGREAEVLGLVTKGFTNQDIAEQLFISPNTVARHVHKILGKIGAANRAEATALAIREGWID